MKLIDKIHRVEDKTERWIINHRFKWVVFLFFLGVVLGEGANLLLGGNLRQGMAMVLSYASILVICEFATGGGGE